MKLLHIDSSILGSHSVSRRLTAAIVDKLKRANPQIEVTYRDLAAAPPAHMTLATLPGDHPSSAKAGPLDRAAQRIRDESQRMLDEFMAADIVVIGVPMYNWSIPTQLKAWIDMIVVPGKTFTYGREVRKRVWPVGSASLSRLLAVSSMDRRRRPFRQNTRRVICVRCCRSWE